MVDWSTIPITKQIISGLYYLKKYFDLNSKEKQLNNLEQELTRLRKISEENSKNFLSMIDFNLHDFNNIHIHAGDNVPVPYLEFGFFISNRSLFDLKIKKISMRIDLENYGEIGEINKLEILDLPHQQIYFDQLNLQLHPHTITILKSLKKEGKNNSLKISLRNMKIDFESDKEFSKPWPYGFKLEIPMDKVYLG